MEQGLTKYLSMTSMLRGAPSQMLALNCTRGMASHRVPERQAAFVQTALVWYQDLNQVVPLLPRVDCDDAQKMTTATTKQKSQHLRPPCLRCSSWHTAPFRHALRPCDAFGLPIFEFICATLQFLLLVNASASLLESNVQSILHEYQLVSDLVEDQASLPAT